MKLVVSNVLLTLKEKGLGDLTLDLLYDSRLVAPMTFMITLQRSHTICSPKSFRTSNEFKGSIRSQGCESLSFHWIRETVQIEVIIVRPNFHMDISELFTICECERPSFEGSVNMDL